jgi:hypothetical protein
MKTLYALALICLSVPAFANELDLDGWPQDYATETGYRYDAGADFNFGDENTAAIIEPATPQSEDYPLELGLGSDNHTAYQDDTVDLEAIQADVWF